jgi:hypothetical protein
LRTNLVRGGVIAAMAGAAIMGVAAAANGADTNKVSLTNVPTANQKAEGYAPASRLSPELEARVLALGSMLVENPYALTSTYGYDNDVTTAGGFPQMLPTKTNPNTEAQKTEPDKNTYVVFKGGLMGADPTYNYGAQFLFQGHEGGAGGNSYVTRINLDADAAHKVTVLATNDVNGNPIKTIDGSTWEPFARRLLLTTENANNPTYAATPGYPSSVTDVSGALGRGGYEGIQDDRDGNIWIVEDIGGSFKTDSTGASTTVKRPNSFIYRYVPASPGDLAHGKLQVLQALNSNGQPITFESQAAVNNPDQVALHSYGQTFRTSWITIHDTATQGNAPFNANTAAKAAHATPFKRPENGVFQPSDGFRNFFFTETGDTDATSVENSTAGGWGSLFQLTQSSPSADTGRIRVFYKGDQVHSGVDNIGFISATQLGAVEDAGDLLHTQRNALDSGYVWDITKNYASGAQPTRWLAEGRDASATIDSSFGGFGKNDSDNEITGLHISNGDPSVQGILGTAKPNFGTGAADNDNNGKATWRWFYTQQHGDNVTYEVLPAGR